MEEKVHILWKILFTELKLLIFGKCFKQSTINLVISKSTLESLEEILIHNYTTNLKIELLIFIMDDILLSIFEKSVSSYNTGLSTIKAREVKQREADHSLQTPTFSFGGAAPPQKENSK
jgi:hypothetical protein